MVPLMRNGAIATVLEEQLPAFANALSALPGFSPVVVDQLKPLPTTGLAHDHVKVVGKGVLIRVPRQSQMALSARENLLYQAACFQRMQESGCTPKLHGTLDPGPDIPMGALVVEEIPGDVVELPAALPDIARTLASIHALTVPAPMGRGPLMDPEDTIAATLDEVSAQGRHLSSPFVPISEWARTAILAEIEAVRKSASRLPRPPKTLISFDAHPGNFIAAKGGRFGDGVAILVDLEKARYGGPGFDLAHATLYTSTTWDVATYAELSTDDVAGFYHTWLSAVPDDLGSAMKDWLLPMRRIMWLWSVTWCAKWAVESRLSRVGAKHAVASTEDWSADNTAAPLINHVAERVSCYLSDDAIARVRSEWLEDNALTRLLSD